MTSLPHHAHIEPTTHCNLRCLSCNNETLPPERRGSLTLESFSLLLDKIPFIQDVSLIGLGESFLNPQLANLAEHLAHRRVQCRTATNGMELDRVDLEKLLTFLDELVISFDAPRAEEFEAIRVGSDFEKILKNITTIVELKKERKLPLTLSLQTVISQKNRNHLFSIPPMAAQLGMDKVRFSAAVQYLPSLKEKEEEEGEKRKKVRQRIRSLQKEDSDEKTLEKELKELSSSNDLDMTFAGFSPRFRECWWPGRGIFLTYDGYVTPCCMRMDPQIFHFGNLYKNTFEQIKKGSAYREFLHIFQRGECPPLCTHCPG